MRYIIRTREGSNLSCMPAAWRVAQVDNCQQSQKQEQEQEQEQEQLEVMREYKCYAVYSTCLNFSLARSCLPPQPSFFHSASTSFHHG